MPEEKTGREYLDQVLSCLRKRLEEVNASIEAGAREIEDMHEYYWENYTEMDQYGYEEFDNRQALLAQVNANQEQLLLRKRFRNMLDSPFFGRVDFIYEGDEEPEQFYIGIGNLAEQAGVLWLMTGELLSADCFMILIKDRHLMKRRWERLPEKSAPSGSIRSAAEKWSMNLKVISRSMTTS